MWKLLPQHTRDDLLEHEIVHIYPDEDAELHRIEPRLPSSEDEQCFCEPFYQDFGALGAGILVVHRSITWH